MTAPRDVKVVAYMRRSITYREADGRTDGERIVSERKVHADDEPLVLQSEAARALADVEAESGKLVMQILELAVRSERALADVEAENERLKRHLHDPLFGMEALAERMCKRAETAEAALAAANARWEAMTALLPGVYYMDPPDGGDVTLQEQMERMAQDAARYRWIRDPASPSSEAMFYELADFSGYGMHEGEALDAAIDALAGKGAGS